MSEQEPRKPGEPLHPMAIPEDTTNTGVFGWMFESVARSFGLRLAALVALIGAAGAAVSTDAPPLLRVVAILVGVSAAFVLLISQLNAWPRRRQWVLITSTLVVSGTLLALLFVLD